MRRAIFAYNHADWYVDSVMLRARLIAGLPGRPGRLAHRPDRGPLPGRRPRHVRGRPLRAGRPAARQARPERGQRDRLRRRRAAASTSSPTQGAPVVAVNDGVVKKIGSHRTAASSSSSRTSTATATRTRNLGSVAALLPGAEGRRRRPDQGATAVSASASRPRPTRSRRCPPRPAARSRTTSGERGGRKAAARRPRRPPPRARRAPGRRQAAPVRPPARPERRGSTAAWSRSSTSDQSAARRQRRPTTTTSRAACRARTRERRAEAAEEGLARHRRHGPRPRRHAEQGTKASHIYFEIRPAGRGAPSIDPKPILDGWKLLESTAIYRASGKNVLLRRRRDGFSIGQILLLPKPLLEKRVLSDERIEIYPGGRRDIQTGQIDRRVLATLEYLAESGLRADRHRLKSGHSFFTSSGNVSQHSSGNAVDIATHQRHPDPGPPGRGRDRRAGRRPADAAPGHDGPAPDHLADGLGPEHAGAERPRRPHPRRLPAAVRRQQEARQAGDGGAEAGPVERPDRPPARDRNPTVPVNPSKYAIPVKPKRASDAHRGE